MRSQEAKKTIGSKDSNAIRRTMAKARLKPLAVSARLWMDFALVCILGWWAGASHGFAVVPGWQPSTSIPRGSFAENVNTNVHVNPIRSPSRNHDSVRSMTVDFEEELRGGDTNKEYEEEDDEPLETITVRCPVPGECEDDSMPTNDSAFSTAATSLHGRLLCASECAYLLEPPYTLGSGYLPGSKLTRLSKGVNSCLVGRTVDGIVVAFRGTQGASPLDWLQNALLYLRTVPKKLAPRGSRVHSGFYGALRGKLGNAIKAVLLEFVSEGVEVDKDNDEPPKIYLMGHSKGGSLASLFALAMLKDKDLPDPTGVCTFGAARVGNDKFAEHFNSCIEQVTYENDLDIIPFLPPGQTTMEDMAVAMDDPENMMELTEAILWSEKELATASRRKRLQRRWTGKYQTIGTRRYITDKGTIVDPVTRELDRRRIADMDRKTLLQLGEFRKAHCPACPSDNCSGGYFAALAPEVCEKVEPMATKAEVTETTTADPNEL